MGPSPADQLLTPDGSGMEGVSAEVRAWAAGDLEAIGTGLHSWHQYKGHLNTAVPASLVELSANNPNLAGKLTRLYEAKQALLASGETTPSGANVGEAMRLAVVPWQEMRNHLNDFDEWVGGLRKAQGLNNKEGYIYIYNKDLIAAIKGNRPFYRDPKNPSQLLTASQYLDRKIAEDGPWGVVLIQTSQEAGIDRIKGQSPDVLTDGNTRHLEIAGQVVDAMGVFEWTVLMLQKAPRRLSTQDFSWMLANRLDLGGTPHVPVGRCYDDQVGSLLYWAYMWNENMRPRLAVM